MNANVVNWPTVNQKRSPLFRLLNQTTDGKSILKAYELHKVLSKNTRNLLTRLIIQEEIDSAFRGVEIDGEPSSLRRFLIKRATFEDLANQIIQLFPKENKFIYYKPYQTVGKHHYGPRGTLFENYEYEKGKLRKNKLLQSRHQDNQVVPVEIADDSQLLLDWLETHVTPADEVSRKFNDTFVIRQRMLKQQKMSVHDYYVKLHCLNTQQGASLLTSDFNRLYPNACNGIYHNWNTAKPFLINCLRICTKIKASSEKDLVHSLTALLPHNCDTVILYLLPFLINCPRKKRGEENNDPIKETRNSFFLHVHTAGDLEPSLQKLRDNLRKASLTLQPLPIFVGDLRTIEAAYVAVNDCLYEVESSLDAINLCFKIFMALDCNYPHRAVSLWTFIQQAMFNIELHSDVCNRSAMALIAEVKNIIVDNSN